VVSYPNLLLIGGPLELDDTEIPDNPGSVAKILKDNEGREHVYWVLRDFGLDRWVGKYQGPKETYDERYQRSNGAV
jgi:hypothetical protein